MSTKTPIQGGEDGAVPRLGREEGMMNSSGIPAFNTFSFQLIGNTRAAATVRVGTPHTLFLEKVSASRESGMMGVVLSCVCVMAQSTSACNEYSWGPRSFSMPINLPNH